MAVCSDGPLGLLTSEDDVETTDADPRLLALHVLQLQSHGTALGTEDLPSKKNSTLTQSLLPQIFTQILRCCVAESSQVEGHSPSVGGLISLISKHVLSCLDSKRMAMRPYKRLNFVIHNPQTGLKWVVLVFLKQLEELWFLMVHINLKFSCFKFSERQN